MAYHDDLIEHAIFLSGLNLPDVPNLPDDPKQVDLRRAVSATYYALFHLLSHGSRPELDAPKAAESICENVSESRAYEDMLFEGLITSFPHRSCKNPHS